MNTNMTPIGATVGVSSSLASQLPYLKLTTAMARERTTQH